MKKIFLPFVAIVCFALYSSAAVAKGCDPNDRANEIRVLALNMYHEARGEGPIAMQMVGEVTLNRVASVNYPNSICEVVYQKSQFSWTKKKNQTPLEKESWALAMKIAEKLVNGDIHYIDNGATHFLNPASVSKTPKWARRFEKVGKYGSHVFYDDGSERVDDYMLQTRPSDYQRGRQI